MSTSSTEALASAWARMEEIKFPPDYEGTASPDAHRASETIQAQIREHITREVEEALREADDPNTKWYRHEEAMQTIREQIDKAEE